MGHLGLIDFLATHAVPTPTLRAQQASSTWSGSAEVELPEVAMAAVLDTTCWVVKVDLVETEEAVLVVQVRELRVWAAELVATDEVLGLQVIIPMATLAQWPMDQGGCLGLALEWLDSNQLVTEMH